MTVTIREVTSEYVLEGEYGSITLRKSNSYGPVWRAVAAETSAAYASILSVSIGWDFAAGALAAVTRFIEVMDEWWPESERRVSGCGTSWTPGGSEYGRRWRE